MQKFDGISFIWALVLMGVIALFFTARALWAWMVVRRDAQEDFAYKQSNDMLPSAIDRENYERIYRKVYSPRGPLYVAAAMVVILVITPFAMKFFELFYNLVYNLSGQNRVFEPPYLVWQFFIFFSMIAVWVGIAYLAARQYHKTAPGSLQFELDEYINGPNEALNQLEDDEDHKQIKTQLILALMTVISVVILFAMRRLS